MTHVPGRFLGFVLALAAIAAPAAAQDDPRFALVTSFPSPTVSFQWELSERFALRFEGSYNYRSESSDSTSGDEPAVTGPFGTSIPITTSTQTESTIHTGSIGVAGIFTIHRSDQLRLYVAPRVSIVMSSERTTASTTVTLPPGLPPNIFRDLLPESGTFESSSTSPAAGASFGAGTNVHRRLALFGEVGFTWSRSDQPLSALLIGVPGSFNDIETKRTTVSTRAVGGLMLLF
jgi:hypothetical protein